MTDDGVWRDEQRVPLADLTAAMATNSADGQVDDETGGDAGSMVDPGGEEGTGDHDPDPDSERGRRLRPSPDGPGLGGRSGPA